MMQESIWLMLKRILLPPKTDGFKGIIEIKVELHHITPCCSNMTMNYWLLKMQKMPWRKEEYLDNDFCWDLTHIKNNMNPFISPNHSMAQIKSLNSRTIKIDNAVDFPKGTNPTDQMHNSNGIFLLYATSLVILCPIARKPQKHNRS